MYHLPAPVCAGIFHMVSVIPASTHCPNLGVKSWHWPPQFFKPMVCTGSCSSWGLGREIICGSFYKWQRETIISSSSGSRCLIWHCWLVLWCLGDGRRGLGIVKLPSLTCPTSSGNAAMTFLPGTPIYISDRGESPLASGLGHSWALLGVFTEPHGNFASPPKFSLYCVFVSSSHYFLPVVLSSKKKLLHCSQHNCKTSRIYSFPSSRESKLRHCLCFFIPILNQATLYTCFQTSV